MSTNMPTPWIDRDWDWDKPVHVKLLTEPKPWAAAVTGLHISKTGCHLIIDSIEDTPTADEIVARMELVSENP